MYSASVAQGTLTEATHRVARTAERDVQELVLRLQRALTDGAPLGLDLSPVQ